MPLSLPLADAFLSLLGGQAVMPCLLSRNTPTKAYCKRSSGQPFPLSGSLADAFLPLSGGQAVMPCLLSRETPTKAYCRRSSGQPCPLSGILCRCFSVFFDAAGRSFSPPVRLCLAIIQEQTNKGTLQTVSRSALPLSGSFADAFLPLSGGQNTKYNTKYNTQL